MGLGRKGLHGLSSSCVVLIRVLRDHPSCLRLLNLHLNLDSTSAETMSRTCAQFAVCNMGSSFLRWQDCFIVDDIPGAQIKWVNMQIKNLQPMCLLSIINLFHFMNKEFTQAWRCSLFRPQQKIKRWADFSFPFLQFIYLITIETIYKHWQNQLKLITRITRSNKCGAPDYACT